MKIGFASDHAGYQYKQALIAYLRRKGISVVDYGTHGTSSVDYPDFAHALAEGIEKGEVDKGIALCGTGNGMAMTLNHHKGIRAGLAWNRDIGALISQHNNANVLVMPARFLTLTMARLIVKTWLETPFEGGRHQRRIDKIPCA